MVNHEKEYALYKGDKLLGIGTKKEIANQLGVKISTIDFYTHPSYAKRTSEEKGRRLIEI
ncbi:hypothetical protein [Streptococcus minor]|uniref:hypothetical protein n=1 Tax=Streptococcus minor TaxID=229549 RepID=UPI000369D473|nr:hypothetical protein [Streptococcus minor]